jgi:hypothetical protein
MHVRTLACVFSTAIMATCAFGQAVQQTPQGWSTFGSHKENYSIQRDSNESGVLNVANTTENSTTPQFISLTQAISAQDYIGNRVAFSAEIATQSAGKAGLWIKVTNSKNQVISVSTLGKDSIKGSTAWQRYNVVIDVPEDGAGIAYGVALHGAGKLQVRNLEFAPVGKDVALSPSLPIAPAAAVPSEPTNLALQP